MPWEIVFVYYVRFLYHFCSAVQDQIRVLDANDVITHADVRAAGVMASLNLYEKWHNLRAANELSPDLEISYQGWLLPNDWDQQHDQSQEALWKAIQEKLKKQLNNYEYADDGFAKGKWNTINSVLEAALK